jgi:DNA polymerase III delta prime subunit
MIEVLTEKYRPKTVDDLVFINDDYERKFRTWVSSKSLDTHVIFYGVPGTGKSSSINVLLNELGIQDFIRLNISDKTSIDDMRKIIDYASVPPMEAEFKLVILEEFERASKQAQCSLKYVMEQFSGWCRFILTTNDISKIDDAIISRCQLYHFNTLKFDEFVTRIVSILTQEQITFDDTDVIVKYVQTYYPDLRACLNAITQHTVENHLIAMNDTNYSNDKFSKVVTSFQTLDIASLKKMITEYISNEEIVLFYQFMYNHLEMITTTQSLWDDILLIIADYLYKHEFVAYTDINLVACLIDIKKKLQVF